MKLLPVVFDERRLDGCGFDGDIEIRLHLNLTIRRTVDQLVLDSARDREAMFNEVKKSMIRQLEMELAEAIPFPQQSELDWHRERVDALMPRRY